MQNWNMPAMHQEVKGYSVLEGFFLLTCDSKQQYCIAYGRQLFYSTLSAHPFGVELCTNSDSFRC